VRQWHRPDRPAPSRSRENLRRSCSTDPACMGKISSGDDWKMASDQLHQRTAAQCYDDAQWGVAAKAPRHLRMRGAPHLYCFLGSRFLPAAPMPAPALMGYPAQSCPAGGSQSHVNLPSTHAPFRLNPTQ
jgi:hypothetical protein